MSTEVWYSADIKKEPCGEKVASYVRPLYNYRLYLMWRIALTYNHEQLSEVILVKSSFGRSRRAESPDRRK